MSELMTQRAGVLAELPAVLREFGVDVGVAFEDSGIEPSTLNSDTRVPFGAMLKLLERAARETGCPHLGLVLGNRFRFEFHGPIGRLMRTAPNLGQALTDFVTWQPGYSSGAIVYLHRLDDVCAFGYGSYASSHPGSHVLYDAVIGVALRMTADLTQGTVQPVEVQFSHREPDVIMPYSRFLKLPMRFDQHRNCIIFDAKSLLVPLPGAGPETRRGLRSEISRLVFSEKPELPARVRHALRSVMFTGKPSLGAVAAELNLHPRTMERRLAKEGHGFRTLRDEVRLAVACELLELTEIPIGEIAETLGFASPGVFTESFRRLTRQSPSAWRKESASRTWLQG